MAAKRPHKKQSGGKWIRIGLPVFAVIVLAVIFIPGSRGTWQWYKSRHEKMQIQEDIRTLKARKARLDSERTLLLNDDAYIEKIAREKYNMKKKGEKVFQIDDKSAH